jgi:hypothetical protein
MKTIGKYKGKDIFIRALHVERTYEGYLIISGDKKRREAHHKELIGEIVGRKWKRYFPDNLPVQFLGGSDINLEDFNTQLTVYVWIYCGDAGDYCEGDGSELLMIWLQDEGEDIFRMASKKLKKIDWAN